MGREVRRVPMSFNFPLDKSFADDVWKKHIRYCTLEKHDKEECSWDWRHEVPTGDGWQLWQTVSDGPVTPVFAAPEDLIAYMSQPVPECDQPSYDPGPYPLFPAGQGWKYETAKKFVNGSGWLPSGIIHKYENGAAEVLNMDEMVEDWEGK